MVQSVNGTKNVSFQSGHRLANGDTEIKWIEETEAKTKGGTVLPGFFHLGLPIFFGDSEATPIKAILRYQVDDGKLAFKIILHRRQEIFEKAVDEQAQRIGAALGLKPLFGDTP